MRRAISSEFTSATILHLIALIMYMVVVCLPCKVDYWSKDSCMSHHPIAHDLGMTQENSIFLWGHFHIYSTEKYEVVAEQEDDNGNNHETSEVNIQEFMLKQVQSDQEVDDKSSVSEDKNESDDKSNEDSPQKMVQDVWFYKLKDMMNHVRSASTGYVVNFTPDGKTAASAQRQEYKHNKELVSSPHLKKNKLIANNIKSQEV
eukprot:10435581-Ditylum_brightwellii.AAC.1